MTNSTKPTLHVVYDASRRDPSAERDAQKHPVQKTLFPERKPGVVVFLEFSAMTDRELVEVMEDEQPGYIFDLRLAPRFDLGSLSRESVFELFSRISARYVDSTSVLTRGQPRTAVFDTIGRVYSTATADLSRPVVFILGNAGSSAVTDDEVLAFLASRGKPATEVRTIPPRLEKAL